jgi:hypothetical protein
MSPLIQRGQIVVAAPPESERRHNGSWETTDSAVKPSARNLPCTTYSLYRVD